MSATEDYLVQEFRKIREMEALELSCHPGLPSGELHALRYPDQHKGMC